MKQDQVSNRNEISGRTAQAMRYVLGFALTLLGVYVGILASGFLGFLMVLAGVILWIWAGAKKKDKKR